MDFQVRISDVALAEFEDLLEYSWDKFPESAERFGNSLLDHVEMLERFPYLGRGVSGKPGVRQLVHTPILIYYRVQQNPNVVEILHFWHASRGDLPF
ncbi:MAG: type II toxin-antitoxin system RelE/ParE family toxin [Acidobacteriia bacterium]|nr:type II toxin-antitoxin system RelE/ParE family toxin [Terriglobia bacterium]